MKRSMQILIGVLVVVVLAAVGYFATHKDKVQGTLGLNKNTNATANTNTGTVTNTNTAPVTGTARIELKGDVTANGSLTVADTALNVTSVEKNKTFQSNDAPAGKVWVVVFFEPIDSAKILTVQDALRKNSTLVSSTGTVNVDVVKVASQQVAGDRGYLIFTVPDTAKNFVVHIGTQQYKLPL